MRHKLAVALAAGSALVLATVPAAFAWSDTVEGAPDLDHDSPTGYYIWHDDGGFHLRTHGPNERHDFVARLTTGGTFEDVDVVKLEDRDGVQVLDGGHELRIEFHSALRGRTHVLATALCVLRDSERLWQAASLPELTMREFSEAFLENYIAAEGEAILGSVGAYRLETRGVQLFSRMTGDHFAVLGLPLFELLEFLRSRGALLS